MSLDGARLRVSLNGVKLQHVVSVGYASPCVIYEVDTGLMAASRRLGPRGFCCNIHVEEGGPEDVRLSVAHRSTRAQKLTLRAGDGGHVTNRVDVERVGPGRYFCALAHGSQPGTWTS